MRLSILHFATIALIIGLLTGVFIYQNEVLPTEHEPNMKMEIILFYCKIYNTSLKPLQNNLASFIVILNVTNQENEAIRLSSIEVAAGEQIVKSSGGPAGYILNMPIFKKTRNFPQKDVSSYIPPRSSKYISINGVFPGVYSTELPRNLSTLVIISGYDEENIEIKTTKLVNIPLNQISPNEYYYFNIPHNMIIEYDENGEIYWIKTGG